MSPEKESNQIISSYRIDFSDHRSLTLTLEDRSTLGLAIFLIAENTTTSEIVEVIYNTSFPGDICDKFESMKQALSLLE